MDTVRGVLLADDDADFALLFRIALESVSPAHHLYTVSDGDEAIHCLSAGSIPQLIILDLHLPRVSGLEVLRWMRERPALASLPAVLITGLAQEGDREKALECGATEFMVKPLEFNCLLELLRAFSLRWLYAESATQQAA